MTSDPGQVSVPAGETSTRLQGLQPLTEYQVTVIALYANSVGEAVSGTARTSEHPAALPAPPARPGPPQLSANPAGPSPAALEGPELTVQNTTAHSLLVAWRGVPGATGYRVTWRLLSGERGCGPQGALHPRGAGGRSATRTLCARQAGPRSSRSWARARGRRCFGTCSPAPTTR